jgi:branched-chain amino acid transport system substrate-binding protein
LGVRSWAAAKPIKIGAVLPLSGYFALEGTTEKKAAVALVEDINAGGGVLGRPFELIVEDGRADPTESVAAARKLISKDGVRAIMGALASSATLAIMSVCEKSGVPLLVETSTSPKITAQGNPWVFRISSTNELDAEALSPHIIKDLEFSKVALLPANNDWGRSVAAAFGNVVERQGGRVVTVEFYEGGETNFSPMLTKIKGSGANSLVITADANTIATVNKQMYSLGMKDLKRMTTSGFPAQQILDMSGAEMSAGVYAITYLPNEPSPEVAGRLNAFIKLYTKKYPGEKIIANMLAGHDGVGILIEAIKLGGSDDPKGLRDALKKIKYKGLTGHLEFDKNGQARPNVYLEQIKNGKVRTVYFFGK